MAWSWRRWLVLIDLSWKSLPTLIIGLVFCLNSCMLFRGNEQSFEGEDESEYEEDSREEDGEESTEDPKDPFAFPKRADAWETQALLLTHNLPASDQVQNCASEISLVAKEASNDEALLNAKKTVIASVKENPILYHWCFFLIARQMDSQIQAGGKNLREKTDYFLGKMKELWILSRALDAYRTGSDYFTYLQLRYVDLSQRVFGRYLEIIGKPLDKRPLEQKMPLKPAEEADVD